jgi:hypothetical protein
MIASKGTLWRDHWSHGCRFGRFVFVDEVNIAQVNEGAYRLAGDKDRIAPLD